RGADVGEEERRRDSGRELFQVAVVPRGMRAAVEPGRPVLAVPADTEAVAVRGRGAHPRVQALVVRRVLALEEQLLALDRRSRVGEPAAHGARSLRLRAGFRG